MDLGLRTGLALYGPDARMVWYRSQHYATRTTLRRGVHGLLDGCPLDELPGIDPLGLPMEAFDRLTPRR